MMKALLTIALLPLFAAQAHAVDLTGTWTGSGRAIDSKGQATVCENVVLAFTQSPTSLSLNAAFTCGGQPITVPSGSMEVRGNELFDKGVKSGTVTDGNLDVTAKAKGYVMRSKAAYTAKDMNLSAVVSIGTNPAPVLTFEAVLHRQ